jgi:hypothetical protein
VLVLCCVFGTSSAKMVKTFSTYYYRLYIPSDWTIDTSSANDRYGALSFGHMYSSDKRMLIEAKLFFYSDWAKISLWNSPKELWDGYLEFLLNDFKDENPTYIDNVIAGKYPAAIITGTNTYGPYLYGEIMLNANAFGFYFYRLDEMGNVDPSITQDDINLFKNIIETFSPTY